MAGGRSQRLTRERYRRSRDGRSVPVAATVPTVSGTNAVGQTLTGTNATFDYDADGDVDAGDTAFLTPYPMIRWWSRNGVPIAGATGGTYLLAAADAGKTIVFHNQARSQYGITTVSSLPRAIP